MLIGIGAAIILIVGIVLASRTNNSAKPTTAPSSSQEGLNETQTKNTAEMSQEEREKMLLGVNPAVPIGSGNTTGTGSATAQTGKAGQTTSPITTHGNYKDYSSDTVTTEQKAGNKVVLFFHAPWCPFCRAADEAFRSKINQIPAGVTVLKTDYDSNTALKQKYGVTYQHTFVQIDQNGNQLTKWNGGDIDNLLKYIK